MVREKPSKNLAVVTGGGSGLGRSLALLLAQEGWPVGIADINREGASQTLKMAKLLGGRGDVMQVDVSNPAEVEEMADYFFGKWGKVDLLINNAGIATAGTISELLPEDWAKITHINYLGTVHGCSSFVPRMIKQGGGHIVNVASVAGMICLPEMSPYNSTKAAIIALSETMKVELAEHNISVTAACPSFFHTPLIDDMKATNDFQKDFACCAFNYARISSAQVAEEILKAVKKDKLYCIPQASPRINWYIKRFNPSLYHGIIAKLIKYNIGKPFIMWLARRGWV